MANPAGLGREMLEAARRGDAVQLGALLAEERGLENGHDAVVRLLVEDGADVNKARTDDGATPLFIACQEGHDAVVRLLVEAGADVNKATTDDGTTPLFIACQEGHDAVVRLLVEAGADVSKARTDDGTTPLFIACQEGHDAVVGVSAWASLAMLRFNGHTDVVEALTTPTVWERRFRLLAWRTSARRCRHDGAFAVSAAAHESASSGECTVA
ncbi:hypothetical protein FNF29_08383 [Cafeteria roenbergensis]|uniref:Uncharacterized protein n=1 Tax=Cafeteria roenbergensis TaxID=33653 RepID=A0A5A8BYZ0_CAFRO|nr:hypothetical protein FNF29_08383 [Cafeteria roenbergensis]|eukprot:KAA0145804.1 hypothetical protein FNF29_08383 [Cafeteria roenbergensis]